MASNTLSGDLISERYGAALYDLASEKKCIDDIPVSYTHLTLPTIYSV